MDYIIFAREALFTDILEKVPSISNIVSINKKERPKPKIIIKSDCPIFHHDKEVRKKLNRRFGINGSSASVTRWLVKHIDFICAQNDDYKNIAIANKIPASSLIVSNMGIPSQPVDYSKLVNPYNQNHSYCVKNSSLMGSNRALLPLYYVDDTKDKTEFNKQKYIIVYTGRVKVDCGRIFFNMKNIMENLGEEYELHIFPGSFTIPLGETFTKHSAKNSNSLELLRDTIFGNNKNVIIHYPYEHHEKYTYLHFAHCGIDFSDVRPRSIKGVSGHAKILEYCEVGLPVVCEENINNIGLVKNGKNGIILPYMASDKEYCQAITKIVKTKIDREYCRKVTIENENWDKKAEQLMNELR